MTTGTWHKQLTARGSSNATNLNFVWQHATRPVYAMDNHLGALWCWLRAIGPSDTCALLHVDRHWDMVDPKPSAVAKLRRWESSTKDLASFLALRAADPNFPLVRWDNYIVPFASLRSVKHASLWCHQPAAIRKHWPKGFSSSALENLLAGLEFAHTGDEETSIIWNLDLDFFFLHDGDHGVVQAYSDDFVHLVAERIHDAIDDDRDVLTIALSPECCGGWSEAERVLGIVSEAMSLGFVLPPTSS